MLVFNTWALGGVYFWAEIATASLAGVAFLLLWALSRRPGQTWRRLRAFPLFGPGLLFLVYILIGTLNPHGEAIFWRNLWAVSDQDYISWLPSSVRAPFATPEHAVGGMNGWRSLLYFASGWLLACTVWAGLGRKALLRLGLIVAVNGVLMAVFAVVVELVPGRAIYPFYTPPFNARPMGPFIYQNHGAAFLNLSLAMVVFFLLRDLRRRRPGEDGPYLLLGATVLFMAFAQIYSLSVIGMLATLGLLAISGFLMMRQRLPQGMRVPALLALGLVVVLGLVLVPSLDQKRIQSQIDKVEAVLAGEEKEPRLHLPGAVLRMGLDRPLYGWGPGSFRWEFVAYQRETPALDIVQGKRRYFFRYAHTDPLQFFAEYGLVGVALALWAAGGAGCFLLRGRRHLQGPEIVLLSGLLLLFLHSTVDFPLYNAAVFLQAGVIATFLLRRAQREGEGVGTSG